MYNSTAHTIRAMRVQCMVSEYNVYHNMYSKGRVISNRLTDRMVYSVLCIVYIYNVYHTMYYTLCIVKGG